jgi:putative PIN family toxin of toxin-antitoxin system
MKIVCDTNVLISAIVFGGNAKIIVRAVSEGKLENYISQAILNEFEDVMQRPKIGFSCNEISVITQLFHETFEYIIPTDSFEVIKDDPDDNKVLDTALATNADFIVSGDKHLLNLGEWNKIKILTPSQFLKIINS